MSCKINVVERVIDLFSRYLCEETSSHETLRRKEKNFTQTTSGKWSECGLRGNPPSGRESFLPPEMLREVELACRQPGAQQVLTLAELSQEAEKLGLTLPPDFFPLYSKEKACRLFESTLPAEYQLVEGRLKAQKKQYEINEDKKETENFIRDLRTYTDVADELCAERSLPREDAWTNYWKLRDLAEEAKINLSKPVTSSSSHPPPSSSSSSHLPFLLLHHLLLLIVLPQHTFYQAHRANRIYVRRSIHTFVKSIVLMKIFGWSRRHKVHNPPFRALSRRTEKIESRFESDQRRMFGQTVSRIYGQVTSLACSRGRKNSSSDKVLQSIGSLRAVAARILETFGDD